MGGIGPRDADMSICCIRSWPVDRRADLLNRKRQLVGKDCGRVEPRLKEGNGNFGVRPLFEGEVVIQDFR